MIMERFCAPAATVPNVITSDHGYSTRSSARRAANRLVGSMMGLPTYGFGRPSVTYRDCGCFGPAHDGLSMLNGDIVVREDMVSIYRAEDGWHWAVEWYLEDLVYDILDKPSPEHPDWCEKKQITFRELLFWDGPRTEHGWPCLDPRYAA